MGGRAPLTTKNTIYRKCIGNSLPISYTRLFCIQAFLLFKLFNEAMAEKLGEMQIKKKNQTNAT